jgi:hypothetical protein
LPPGASPAPTGPYSTATPEGAYSSSTAPYPGPPSAAPPIIAMAPIPNPEEGESRADYVDRVAPPASDAASGYRYKAPPPRRAVVERDHRVERRHRRAVAAPYYPAAAVPYPRVAAHPHVAAASHAVAVAPPPAAVAPRAGPGVPNKAEVKPAPKPVAKLAPPATVAPIPTVTPAPKQAAPALNPATPAIKEANAQGATPLSDRATRLAALETALAEAIHKDAVLKTPSPFTAGKAVEVTLTIPADFGQTVKDEAAKNDLSDAAASVNLVAVLSGDGFSATPDAAQSQPLTPGQPTEFKWSVTARDGAKGPLHADVGADLLGAGSDVLNLGSVQTGQGFGLGALRSNRMLGLAILAVLAVLVLAWLARGRSGPSRSAEARREARRARTERPAMGDS